MSDLKKKRLPKHMAQSSSPARGIRGIEKPLSWFAKLVGRPSKPIDVEVPEVQVQIQPNLTTNYFNDMAQKKSDDAIMRNYKGDILDPTTGEVPGSSAYYDKLSRMHTQEDRTKQEDQLHDDAVAAHNEWMDTHPNWEADKRYNAERLKYVDEAALKAAHAASSWGHLTPKRWLQRKKYRLPNMTVPSDVGKPNSAIANYRLYGPLGLGRNDPPGANRMYYPRGGKSKRSKSKRSNKGKKTHRYRSRSRSRSTCRRSTCRRSTCRRSTCRR